RGYVSLIELHLQLNPSLCACPVFSGNRRVRDPYARWCERRTPSVTGGAVYSIRCIPLFSVACLSVGEPYSFAILAFCGWLVRIANVYGFGLGFIVQVSLFLQFFQQDLPTHSNYLNFLFRFVFYLFFLKGLYVFLQVPF